MRQLLPVDVEALNRAILDSPLTASTAFSIYAALGLPQFGAYAVQDLLDRIPEHSPMSANPCLDSTAAHLPVSSGSEERVDIR